ncbi:MAG TPA: hypothetical protein VKY39_05480, partial [Aggregatilineales bacterium]|nr:hypothetical protein [Aggregatilineales bacterium]
MDEHDAHQHHHAQGEHAEHVAHTDEPLADEAADTALHGRDLDEHAGHDAHTGHAEHAGHGVDHTGHEIMFRNRFWICLLLTIPVLIYSPMLQMWFGFTAPQFPGSQFVGPFFAVIIFLYGGIPFLQMAVPELRNRQPGMMTLVSLAITT